MPWPRTCPFDNGLLGCPQVDEWVAAAGKFPQLAEPIFNLQACLRGKVIGAKFCERRGPAIRQG